MAALLAPMRYAAAQARVRGRLARLLSPAQWADLVAASDLSELLRLLQETPYGETLARLDERTPTPQRVERALRAYLARAVRAPLYLLQGTPRSLLDWIWRRFEVENLKTILRTIDQDVPIPQVRAALTPLGEASALPWNQLAGAGSVAAVVEQLRASFHGAFYARALDRALNQYQRENSVFVLEVTLDLAYHRRLLRTIEKLSGRDRQEAERFVGTMVESQNLLWAFRYRIYFQLSPEEILNYTLQRGLRVDAAVVRQIATGAPPLAVVRQLWDDRLPGLAQLTDRSPAEVVLELELLFRRYLYGLAWNALVGFPLHLGVILAHAVLLESEVRDLITVVEGKAAAWPSERIRPYLIRTES